MGRGGEERREWERRREWWEERRVGKKGESGGGREEKVRESKNYPEYKYIYIYRLFVDSASFHQVFWPKMNHVPHYLYMHNTMTQFVHESSRGCKTSSFTILSQILAASLTLRSTVGMNSITWVLLIDYYSSKNHTGC